MPDPEFIDPSQIQPGPIRHASLSEEVLTQAKAAFDVLAPYLETTLEQFEINLMRDSNPEAEVAVWCNIAAAWIEYHGLFEGRRTIRASCTRSRTWLQPLLRAVL